MNNPTAIQLVCFSGQRGEKCEGDIAFCPTFSFDLCVAHHKAAHGESFPIIAANDGEVPHYDCWPPRQRNG